MLVTCESSTVTNVTCSCIALLPCAALAAEYCGGLCLSGTAAAIISNTTFAHNQATFDGGAIGLRENATAEMMDVVVKGNTADSAAGIDVAGDAILRLQNASLTSNVADKSGGALYAAGHSRVLGTLCTVSNNTA